jgi:hypothetical protein
MNKSIDVEDVDIFFVKSCYTPPEELLKIVESFFDKVVSSNLALVFCCC